MKVKSLIFGNELEKMALVCRIFLCQLGIELLDFLVSYSKNDITSVWKWIF